MKRIIAFLLLFAALKVAGQTTGYLRFDTVKIMKQNGTCELYIINATKDSLGQLTNVGGGLTRFIRPRVLNDSMFIVGLDTLTIVGSGSGGSSSVTTDITLTGDGSPGNPLKVDTSRIATISRIRDSVVKKYGLDTNFLKINNIDIYFGVVRPVSDQVSGHDIVWDWIDDGAHTFYGFTNHIFIQDGHIAMSIPHAKVIYTGIVSPDESLSQYGLTVGSKFTSEYLNAWAYYDAGTYAGAFTGTNGSASLTIENNSLTGWTTSYTPTNGQIRFNYPSVPQTPSIQGATLSYYGTNGYQLERMVGGLAGMDMGWVVKDLFGNTVTDTLTTSDRFAIISPVSVNVGIQDATVGTTNSKIYDAGFKNYWIIAVVHRDTLSPGNTSSITVDSTSISGQISLNWNDVAKANTYQVERSTHYNYGYSNVYTGATSAFTDTGLTPGTVYYYRIRGVNTDAAPDVNGGWWVVRGGTPL